MARLAVLAFTAVVPSALFAQEPPASPLFLSSAELWERASELAEALPEGSERDRALWEVASSYAAVARYSQAESVAAGISDDSERQSLYLGICSALQIRGDLLEALDCLERIDARDLQGVAQLNFISRLSQDNMDAAIVAAHRLGSVAEKVNAFCQLASVASEQQPDRSAKLLRRALQLLERVEPRERDACYRSIAFAYARSGDLERATVWLERIVSPGVRLNALENLARSAGYYRLADDQVAALVEQARSLVAELGNADEGAYLLALAQMEWNLGHAEAAGEALAALPAGGEAREDGFAWLFASALWEGLPGPFLEELRAELGGSEAGAERARAIELGDRLRHVEADWDRLVQEVQQLESPVLRARLYARMAARLYARETAESVAKD